MPWHFVSAVPEPITAGGWATLFGQDGSSVQMGSPRSRPSLHRPSPARALLKAPLPRWALGAAFAGKGREDAEAEGGTAQALLFLSRDGGKKPPRPASFPKRSNCVCGSEAPELQSSGMTQLENYEQQIVCWRGGQILKGWFLASVNREEKGIQMCTFSLSFLTVSSQP